jgi:hypothetical protein
MTAGGRVSLQGDGSEAGCGVVWSGVVWCDRLSCFRVETVCSLSLRLCAGV